MNTLNIEIADTFLKRLKGLMFSKKRRAIFIPSCGAIHTFFMRYPIHCLWIKKNQIIKIDRGVAPNRIKRCPEADGVLELPADTEKPRGQALVETALIFPILFILIFGFIELSLAIAEKQKLTYVASFAAQTGSISNDDQKIAGAIQHFYTPGAENSLNGDKTAYEILSKNIGNAAIASSERKFGDVITVKLQEKFSLPIRIPLNGGKDLSVINLTAEASSRVVCNNIKPPYTCTYETF